MKKNIRNITSGIVRSLLLMCIVELAYAPVDNVQEGDSGSCHAFGLLEGREYENVRL